LLALQIGIPTFLFDTLWWSDGLLELPKPVPVIDSGEGLVIPPGSTFVASFEVGGQKRIVSQGTTQDGARIQIDGTLLTFTANDLRLPFGGYTVDKTTVLVTGGLVAAH
jgi:hypothetical protein